MMNDPMLSLPPPPRVFRIRIYYYAVPDVRVKLKINYRYIIKLRLLLFCNLTCVFRELFYLPWILFKKLPVVRN